MAYTYITSYDSPNYTPANETRSVWGVDRSIQAICIHWWGDPAQNPTFEGVISTLLNPARESSAHYIATGTGRRVACIVAPADNAWANNSGNPTTVSIECDPRCRDEDYDVVGELVAELRDTYGQLPLVPHNKYIATRCPGNWDLNRINAVASNKIPGAVEGQSRDKTTTPAKKYATTAEVNALYVEILERQADAGGLNTRVGKQTVEEVRAALMASQERSVLVNNKAKAQAEAVRKAQEVEAKLKAESDAKRIADSQAAQQKAIEQSDHNPQPTAIDIENNSLLKQILAFIQRIFK